MILIIVLKLKHHEFTCSLPVFLLLRNGTGFVFDNQLLFYQSTHVSSLVFFSLKFLRRHVLIDSELQTITLILWLVLMNWTSVVIMDVVVVLVVSHTAARESQYAYKMEHVCLYSFVCTASTRRVSWWCCPQLKAIQWADGARMNMYNNKIIHDHWRCFCCWWFAGLIFHHYDKVSFGYILCKSKMSTVCISLWTGKLSMCHTSCCCLRTAIYTHL